MVKFGFFSFTLRLISAAVRPELASVEKPRTSGFSFSTHLRVSSTVKPSPGWSNTETSTPISSRTVAKYSMLRGGNAAMDFLPSRSSMPSFGLALIKENFMLALLFFIRTILHIKF